MNTIQVKKQPKPLKADVEDDDKLYNTRASSSVRRYRTNPPTHADTLDDLYDEPYIQQRRASRKIQSVHTPEDAQSEIIQGARASRKIQSVSTSTLDTRSTAPQPVEKVTTQMLPQARRFPLVAVMVGMVITVVLVMSISLVSSWWQTYQDDLHYGRPRTYQMDAVVGHNDSVDHPTHFIFLNLNRHVEIIEIPGGDASKTRIFSGPVLFGDGQNLVPVTGAIRNDNGRKDLVIHIQNQDIVFINDGTTFHPQ